VKIHIAEDEIAIGRMFQVSLNVIGQRRSLNPSLTGFNFFSLDVPSQTACATTSQPIEG